MLKKYLNEQKGATMVFSFALLFVFIGIAGIVLDVGNLYVEKSKMQNAADMAAMAGAQEIPNISTAESAAKTYIKNNKQEAADTKITWSNENTKITVTLSKKIPTYLMGVFGIKTVNIGVHATATALGGDKFQPTLYSNHDIEMQITTITGDVYSGGNITYLHKNSWDKNTIAGNVDATGSIIGTKPVNYEMVEKTWGKKDFGKDTSGAKTQEMPTYDIPTPNVTSNKTSLTVADWKFGANLGLTADNVTMNLGSSSVSGAIIAKNNLTIKASSLQVQGGQPLLIYSEGTGTITLEVGSGDINAIIYAPHGKVVLKVSACHIHGNIVADDIEIAKDTSLMITGLSSGSSKPSGKRPKLIE